MKGGIIMDYKLIAKIFKALGDSNRVQIVDLLSCGELCACDLLEHFNFTQPTLSHHMKVLISAEIVQTRKSGIWHNYSLNEENMTFISDVFQSLVKNNENCICHSIENGECSCNNDQLVNSSNSTYLK